MKKYIMLFFLCSVFLVTSCTSIDPYLTGPKVQTAPTDDYYGDEGYVERDYGRENPYYYRPSYNPYYSSSFYSPYYYYMPSFWWGIGWWNPFFYSGFYDYYYYYHPMSYWYGRNWGYPSYTTYRNGRAIVTKKALQRPSSRTVNRGRVSTRSTSSRGSSTSRGTVSRAGSTRSRGTATRSSGSRGSSGSSTRVKKK